MQQRSQTAVEMGSAVASFEHVSRRSVLGGLWALAQLASTAAVSLTGCGGEGTTPVATGEVPQDAVPPTAHAANSASIRRPSLGAHSLVYNRDGVAVAPLSTPPMGTRAASSTMLVCVGRGIVSTHGTPSDGNANVYIRQGSTHVYTMWPTSGTALYACAKAAGGAGQVVSVPKPVATDETTLSVVEVVNGGAIVDVKWNEVLAGNPLTSRNVTTTGPALLVAWWWGDAGVDFEKTAVPDNKFTVIDSVLLEGALVQCAVAVRRVNSAGKYRVTWTASPIQGAQLWIAVVQYAA